MDDFERVVLNGQRIRMFTDQDESALGYIRIGQESSGCTAALTRGDAHAIATWLLAWVRWQHWKHGPLVAPVDEVAELRKEVAALRNDMEEMIVRHLTAHRRQHPDHFAPR